jgi:hypothetical protein
MSSTWFLVYIKPKKKINLELVDTNYNWVHHEDGYIVLETQSREAVSDEEYLLIIEDIRKLANMTKAEYVCGGSEFNFKFDEADFEGNHPYNLPKGNFPIRVYGPSETRKKQKHSEKLKYGGIMELNYLPSDSSIKEQVKSTFRTASVEFNKSPELIIAIIVFILLFLRAII